MCLFPLKILGVDGEKYIFRLLVSNCMSHYAAFMLSIVAAHCIVNGTVTSLHCKYCIYFSMYWKCYIASQSIINTASTSQCIGSAILHHSVF